MENENNIELIFNTEDEENYFGRKGGFIFKSLKTRHIYVVISQDEDRVLGEWEVPYSIFDFGEIKNEKWIQDMKNGDSELFINDNDKEEKMISCSVPREMIKTVILQHEKCNFPYLFLSLSLFSFFQFKTNVLD